MNGTAMNVSWAPLNLVEARGIVRSYIITYQQASSRRKRQMQMVQVDGSASYAIVGGLQSGVTYEATISGVTTQAGPGEIEWSMELEVALVSHKILLTHLRAFVLSVRCPTSSSLPSLSIIPNTSVTRTHRYSDYECDCVALFVLNNM